MQNKKFTFLYVCAISSQMNKFIVICLTDWLLEQKSDWVKVPLGELNMGRFGFCGSWNNLGGFSLRKICNYVYKIRLKSG